MLNMTFLEQILCPKRNHISNETPYELRDSILQILEQTSELAKCIDKNKIDFLLR
jgi:hypothetical protein